MTPSEFKKILDFRQLSDSDFNGGLNLILQGDTETTRGTIDQLALFILKPVLDQLIPAGVPIPWPNDTPPSGWVSITNGFSFDTTIYTELAKAWPSGVIPAHRGRVIECTADGSSTGAVLDGEVKNHDHEIQESNVTLSNTFNVSRTGTNTVSIPYANNDGSGAGFQSGTLVGGSKTINVTNNAQYSVNVDFGDHKHDVSVQPTGGARNTVDRINYNYIVRLA